VIAVSRYTMTATSQFLAFITRTEHGTIVSAGPAVLDGTFVLADGAVPEGTYELIRGNPLSGTFDLVTLPDTGVWSWRIEGNSLLATKGKVSAEATTWSRLKAGTGRIDRPTRP
jgi:hypothetical protein